MFKDEQVQLLGNEPVQYSSNKTFRLFRFTGVHFVLIFKFILFHPLRLGRILIYLTEISFGTKFFLPLLFLLLPPQRFPGLALTLQSN